MWGEGHSNIDGRSRWSRSKNKRTSSGVGDMRNDHGRVTLLRNGDDGCHTATDDGHASAASRTAHHVAL
jgi:hypothetical protein